MGHAKIFIIDAEIIITQNPTMLDLIYLLATAGFFLGCIAYAHWCGKI